MESTDWIIYTRTDPPCPWCHKIKILLTSKGYEFVERNIYNIYDEQVWVPGAPITVPQVYHKGMLIGGYERTKEYIERLNQ